MLIPTKTELRTIRAFIRAELDLRQWTYADLGAAAGLGEDMARNICMGWAVSPGRRKIELALGVPIWTAQHVFTDLARRAAVIGLDPVLTTKREIAVRAKEVGCRLPRRPSRATALAVLEAHFAAKSKEDPAPANV